MAIPIKIEQLLEGKVVESERVDFKKGWNPVDVAHSICAFANDVNNWGGGYIVTGIEEQNGSPVLPPCGVPLRDLDRMQKELVNITHKIEPYPTVISDPIEYMDKMLFVIWVPGGDYRPYKAPNTLGEKEKTAGKSYYIRQGSVTHKANAQEEQRVLALASRVPFDDRVCYQASLDDLNLMLIRDYLRRTGSRISDNDAIKISFETLCWNLQIVGGPTEDLHPRNIGLLLFSDNPEKYIPYARIEVVHFFDDIGDRFEEKIFKGPMHIQLIEALAYIKNIAVVERVEKVPGEALANRAFSYPYDAIEEVLSNSVYHKSYDDRNPIEVRINHDSIQVLSFEGPMPPIGQDDLKKKRVVCRHYRNRRIGEFLKEMDMTEGRSTGFPKIYRAMEANGSPTPLFETDKNNSYFLATLPIHPAFLKDPSNSEENPNVIVEYIKNPDEEQKTDEKEESKSENEENLKDRKDSKGEKSSLDDTALKILDLLKENPKMTGKEMSEILDVSERHIERGIRTLRNLNYLKRKGSKKFGSWIVRK